MPWPVIGGHSKFLLITGDCCRKRWQLLSCLLWKSFEKGTCPAGYWRCSFSLNSFWQDSFWRYSMFTSGLFIGFVFPCGLPLVFGSFRPHGNTPNKNCAKIVCLDTMIGGHSKFLLRTGKFCNKRWQQLLSGFAKLRETNLSSWVLALQFLSTFLLASVLQEGKKG